MVIPVAHEYASFTVTLLRFFDEPFEEVYAVLIMPSAVMLEAKVNVRKDSHVLKQIFTHVAPVLCVIVFVSAASDHAA